MKYVSTQSWIIISSVYRWRWKVIIKMRYTKSHLREGLSLIMNMRYTKKICSYYLLFANWVFCFLLLNRFCKYSCGLIVEKRTYTSIFNEKWIQQIRLYRLNSEELLEVSISDNVIVKRVKEFKCLSDYYQRHYRTKRYHILF